MLRNWQLAAAAVWAGLAAGILLRAHLLDADALDRLPVQNWTVANLICAFLCVWNLARWYQAQTARRTARDTAQPLQPDRGAGTRYEYNPEFDFQKSDKPAEGPP